MIRFSTPDDFDAMVRVCKDFFQASPYAHLGLDENRVSELVWNFLNGDRRKILSLVLEVDGAVVGLLAAAISEGLFNYRLMAAELVWWIDPEHRNFRNASAFLDAYEYWAKAMGAQVSQLVSIDEKTGKFYRHKGYKMAEYAYIKEH